MNTQLLTVAIRQSAIIVPGNELSPGPLSASANLLVANLDALGYSVSEALLQALNAAQPEVHTAILNTFREVTGVSKNWTPLVKGWDTPTGEGFRDHLVTYLTNVFGGQGTRLSCGHTIPPNTFPLERYNGCPFCGTPFVFATLRLYKQGSSKKELQLWRRSDAEAFLQNLLLSNTALDATQADSLKILLTEFPLPEGLVPKMKETLMLLIDALIESGRGREAGTFFKSPVDIMRYLWFRHTGFLQILEPRSIVQRTARNHAHHYRPLDQSASAKLIAGAVMKLRYNRAQCALAAGWINALPMDAQTICEAMHPKRRMWVRFIRALRLAEWAKRPGFTKLAEVLDRFYREDYTVWQGAVDNGRLRYDAAATFALLQARPGAFARSLFANMLWFGRVDTITAFTRVADKVPARLLVSLAMYAESYFDAAATRSVKPLGGNRKTIPANGLIRFFQPDELQLMQTAVKDLCLDEMSLRFMARKPEGSTMFIDPLLYKIPVSIGDRSEMVQDIPSALMGMRFPVEGDSVRLFMQWGTGLSARHLDMDLSCSVLYDDRIEFCSYYQLVATGCKHSGDIREIPDQVGTAEYIELELSTLRKAGARYVAFTCNAYSAGSLSPNMTVGWMSSRYSMRISERSGVAYDPSCVQQQVRIMASLSKGMVFGVLDVAAAEVIWLELPFQGQIVQQLDTRGVDALIRKLGSKLNIGQLLRLKAEAQQIRIVTDAQNAELVYTPEWARDTAAVTQLLVD